MAAATKDLGKIVVPTMVAIVRHYTMVAISQQAGMFGEDTLINVLQKPFFILLLVISGPFPYSRRNQVPENYMDSLILAEAIATVMGYEEKELCKPGRLALAVMLGTASTILGSKKRVNNTIYGFYFEMLMSKFCI